MGGCLVEAVECSGRTQLTSIIPPARTAPLQRVRLRRVGVEFSARQNQGFRVHRKRIGLRGLALELDLRVHVLGNGLHPALHTGNTPKTVQDDVVVPVDLSGFKLFLMECGGTWSLDWDFVAKLFSNWVGWSVVDS